MSFVTDYLGVLSSMRPAGYPGINGYACLADFVLQHGQEFVPAPLPDWCPRGEKRQCYRNAALLALDQTKVWYVEGFAMGVVPVNHAWCVDRHGQVVDPTWQIGLGYFGIVIKREYLRKRLLVQKTYGLLDRWEERWPMIHDAPRKWKERWPLLALPKPAACPA